MTCRSSSRRGLSSGDPPRFLALAAPLTKIGSFREWLDRPRAWLPVILIVGASAAALLEPNAAHAAHAATLQNSIAALGGPATGQAGTMLGSLMPGLLATPTPLTLAIGAFSAMLMAYATQQKAGVKELIAPPRGGPGKPSAPKPEKGANAEATAG